MKRVLFWLLLVGCGGTEKTTSSTNVPAAPPPPTSATAAPSSDSDEGDEASGGVIGLMSITDAGSGAWGSLAGSWDAGPSWNTLGPHSPAANATLSRDAIRTVIRRNFSKLRACYEEGMKANPDLAGKVVVKFTIGTAGTVLKADPTNDTTLPDASVVSCVTKEFGRLVFPKPDSGDVVVAYPIIFSPQ